jgi:NADH-quinone oxidoreductase subunit N
VLTTETVFLLTPEIALALVAVTIYLAGAAAHGRGPWSWIAAGGVIVSAMALWITSDRVEPLGPLALDALARYVRWLVLACGGLLVMLTSRPRSTRGTAEYVGSLLLATAGAMLACVAGDLVLLFVSLELVSIPTYVILYLGRRDAASQESAAKYFFLSVLASAIFLYGLSFLYGAAGSLDLRAIREHLAGAAGQPGGFGGLAKLAGVLVFAGLGFKITAVPFHFYAPDVYQGTTNPNAALLSILPKMAGFVALVRIVALAVPAADPYWFAWRIALALAVLTMTFGNVLALWQDNVRRLMAYSSIAHSGYMLVALAVALAPGSHAAGTGGLAALVLYLLVYALATIGVFAVLTWLGRRGEEVDGVDELAGLGRTRPLVAALLAVFLFSLAGIPPLAGFWGKLAVFAGALGVRGQGGDASLQPWFVGLAVVGVLNAAVAAAYYLRIVGVMYFRMPLGSPKPQGSPGALATALLCGAATLLLGVYPGPLFRESEQAGTVAVADSREAASVMVDPQERNVVCAFPSRGVSPRSSRADTPRLGFSELSWGDNACVQTPSPPAPLPQSGEGSCCGPPTVSRD